MFKYHSELIRSFHGLQGVACIQDELQGSEISSESETDQFQRQTWKDIVENNIYRYWREQQNTQGMV